MTILKNVHDARIRLKARGSTDVTKADQIEDMVNEAQELIAQMNKAKIAAMREAEKPYLEKLEALDKRIAVFITIMS